MNENEIITAWKCCSNVITSSCKECPLHLTYNANCVRELMRVSLDLFNRQKAEIERLRCSAIRNGKQIGSLIHHLEQSKSEAYREFAERVKEKSHISLNKCGEMIPLIYFEDIDNTLKELTEKNDLEESET